MMNLFKDALKRLIVKTAEPLVDAEIENTIEKPGFRWVAADAVDAMAVADECTDSKGDRWCLIDRRPPEGEDTFTFKNLKTGNTISIKASEASARMTPDENRVAGLGYFEPLPPGDA